jgi:putative membrane protein
MDLANTKTQIILIVCAIVWVACAINPHDFEAWLLEQFATLCALAVLAWCVYHRIHFTTSSQISIALLFIVHTIGTHFTYSLTPYDSFLQSLAGFSLNDLCGWERNHYDRFVHLLYGVCLALPVAGVLIQRLQISTFTARFLAFHIIVSTSAIYELIEWTAAVLFGGDLGTLYLGTQGDIWDAQADIAIAAAGQLVVYAACFVVSKIKIKRGAGP